MKICLMTISLYSYGGVQRVTSTILNELAKDEKNTIEILYLGKLEYSKEKLYGLNENRIKIINFSLKNSFFNRARKKLADELNKNCGIFNSKELSKIYEWLIYSKKIKEQLTRYLNENKYDIVIGSEGPMTLLLGAIAKEINAKTIGWQHNSFDAYYERKKAYFWNQNELSKRLLKRLDSVIVLSDSDKDKYYDKFGVECKRIYNPLSFRSIEKSTCTQKTILSIGRLHIQKGYDLLIEAFEKVTDNNDDWNLIIVGNGPEYNNLRDLINNKGLNNRITIKEFTNDVEKYYINSSIFVSTSRWEGFGLVITEAMECGLPIISFDNAGPREIIYNDINGIIIEKENILELSNTILELTIDENKRKKMGKNAVVRAESFHVTNIANEWIKVFNELIEREGEEDVRI